MASKPARIWLGTIPYSDQYDLTERLTDPGVAYGKGQRERGADTGYEHWQLIVYLKKPQRRSKLVSIFGSNTHWEPTRSEAADAYVWKDDTSVAGTRFEHGTKPINRNNPKDWDTIKDLAKCGRLDDIPSDIFIRMYGNLRKIASDYAEPLAIERTVNVYWGRTRSGKSRRAWEEATFEAYPKDPRTKFWDGYRGQEHVVIDEFRGGIDIAHILRWFDRYPVNVEIKGSSTVLKAKTIWVTSNLDPNNWYPELDDETRNALMERMNIIHFI